MIYCFRKRIERGNGPAGPVRKDGTPLNQEEILTGFEDMDLSTEIMKAVEKMGFHEATPIQAKTIPVMMEGHDVIGIAPTGTGKTCAFGIPMLEYISLTDTRIQELVLAPTRELAVQIGHEMEKLAAFIPEVRTRHGSAERRAYDGD